MASLEFTCRTRDANMYAFLTERLDSNNAVRMLCVFFTSSTSRVSLSLYSSRPFANPAYDRSHLGSSFLSICVSAHNRTSHQPVTIKHTSSLTPRPISLIHLILLDVLLRHLFRSPLRSSIHFLIVLAYIVGLLALLRRTLVENLRLRFGGTLFRCEASVDGCRPRYTAVHRRAEEASSCVGWTLSVLHLIDSMELIVERNEAVKDEYSSNTKPSLVKRLIRDLQIYTMTRPRRARQLWPPSSSLSEGTRDNDM